MGECTADQAALGRCPTTKKAARCTGEKSKNTDTVSVKVEDDDDTYDCFSAVHLSVTSPPSTARGAARTPSTRPAS